MTTIKWHSPFTNTNEVSYTPDSTKDIHHALWAHGVPARVCKLQGQYVMIFNTPKTDDRKPLMVDTGCTRVWSMTLKGWVEFGNKHCPSNVERLTPGVLYEDLIKKVNQSTL